MANNEDTKYEYHFADNIMMGSYFDDDNETMLKTENLDFINWLNLNNGVMRYMSKYEKYADAPLN